MIWGCYRYLDARFKQVLAAIGEVKGIVNTMPTDAEFQSALAAFKSDIVQAVTDAGTRVTTDIDALKAKIDAGGTVSQADLDALAQTHTDVLTAIAGIDPAATP